MASPMTAVDIRGGAGTADALFLNDNTPAPVLAPGQALVRVKAFGLNRLDLVQRAGHYPPPPGAPATLGVEFSGVVEAVRPTGAPDEQVGGRPFAVGDAVFGLVGGGAYAALVAAPLCTLLHKPPTLSWVEAAAVPETWFTALQALHEVGGFPDAPVEGDGGRRGKTVLWHAGASGVSIAGIQLARRAGARAVYATAGSDAKCAFAVRALGATAAFNYKDPSKTWSDALAHHEPAGVDLVVDFVGASYFQQNLAAAAVDGHIVLLAFLGGARLPAGADLAPLLRKRLRLEGSSLRSRAPSYQARLRDRLAAALPDLRPAGAAGAVGATPDTAPPAGPPGALHVFVDRVFPWTAIKDAHEYMEKNVSMGKIVCTIP